MQCVSTRAANKGRRRPNLIVIGNFHYIQAVWAGTVKTVPTKLMTKIVGTDLSVPGLTRSMTIGDQVRNPRRDVFARVFYFVVNHF